MTITLAQAKRLSELGVRKEAYWSWTHWKVSGESGLYHTSSCNRQQLKEGRNYPAYNAEELIKLLRAKEHIQIDIYSHGDGFMFHQEGSWVAGEDDIHGSTLTEALGNKLIHDLENGIITAGEVNK